MTVIIRNSGYAWLWTCKTMVMRDGKLQPCEIFDVAATEVDAKKAYASHKKTAKGH